MDLALDDHAVAVGGRGLLERAGHVVHDHRVLLAVVLGVGEQERQQPLLAELGDGPEEGGDAAGPGPDVGRGVGVARPGRGHDADAAERAGLQAEQAVALALGLVEAGVGWSRKSRSSPLTLKISALVLAVAAPSTPE
jgi:hypothetical protein